MLLQILPMLLLYTMLHLFRLPYLLQNKHYDGADAKIKGQHYLYPHDYPNHWVAQQYLPDAIKDRQYYVPGENKNEQAFAQYWKKIKGE